MMRPKEAEDRSERSLASSPGFGTALECFGQVGIFPGSFNPPWILYFLLWDVQIFFPLEMSFSKPTDLLKIYFLIGQYFLILLYMWVSWHFPSSDFLLLLLFLLIIVIILIFLNSDFLLFNAVVLRMKMLKKMSSPSPAAALWSELSGEVGGCLAPFWHPGPGWLQGQASAFLGLLLHPPGDPAGLELEMVAVCSPSPPWAAATPPRLPSVPQGFPVDSTGGDRQGGAAGVADAKGNQEQKQACLPEGSLAPPQGAPEAWNQPLGGRQEKEEREERKIIATEKHQEWIARKNDQERKGTAKKKKKERNGGKRSGGAGERTFAGKSKGTVSRPVKERNAKGCLRNGWENAKNKPRLVAKSYGDANGKLAGFYSGNSYPEPDFRNPVP